MTEEQIRILTIVSEMGSVPPNTFSGKGSGIGKGIGFVVAGLVRRGYMEWERGRLPDSASATALLITDAGRRALQGQTNDHAI